MPESIGDKTREERFELFKSFVRDDLEMIVHKERLQPGRSFSQLAMERLAEDLALFVGARVVAAWERRNEPPTYLRVRVEVEVG